MKSCSRCGQRKPLEAFHLDHRKRDGRHSACAECENAKAVARRAERRALKPQWPRRTDLTGRTFGRLTVLSMNPEDHIAAGGQRRARWDCLCECGKETTTAAANLTSGRSTSCGCYAMELRVALGHLGMLEKPTYSSLHKRIRDQFGPAGRRPCHDCGGRARAWSYQHNDPNELTQPHTLKSGKIIHLAYSTDLSRYVPRCTSCHNRFDKAHRRARAAA